MMQATFNFLYVRGLCAVPTQSGSTYFISSYAQKKYSVNKPTTLAMIKNVIAHFESHFLITRRGLDC
ncbi:MAG: hypothetical protein CK528_03000 [Alcaligenaceae bacterium]|nr:MAG: hypothetical protein CK528_03000 [Alcaligenaceae bacterium]